jgi:hypothetical protein
MLEYGLIVTQPFKRRIKSHLPFANIIRRFNVYGSVQLKYIQQDATLHSLFITGNCSTCFGWYFHLSSGAHTTVSTSTGICHTVTGICRYRGRVGTGLGVLWVTYATHSTLKLVPLLFPMHAICVANPIPFYLIIQIIFGGEHRTWMHCAT